MNYKVILLLVALITAFACTNNEDTKVALEGTYTGTFEREGSSSEVTLYFDSETYSGKSDMTKFPAICDGNYSTTNNNTIAFKNTCLWTADFDWSLILDGEWTYTLTTTTLTLSKTNGDTYTLKKQ